MRSAYTLPLFSLGLAGLLQICLGDAAYNNQSLVKTDQTCQRIVLTSAGQASQQPASETSLLEDFTPVQVGFQFSHAHLHDHSLGKGASAYDESVTFSTQYKQRLQLQAVVGREDYYWDYKAYRLNGEYVDLAALYDVWEQVYVGPFFEISYDHIKRRGQPYHTETILASGLLATKDWQLDKLDVALTGTLASMNKRNLAEIGDSNDTAAALLCNVRYAILDHTGIGGYAYYYSLLNNPRTTDGHYWLFGTQLDQQLGRHWLLTAGIGKTVADDSYDQVRYDFSVNYLF